MMNTEGNNMQWSIYKNSSLPYEQWEECYTAWFVDRDMDTLSSIAKVKFLHDGFYPVYFGKNSTTAEVRDGKFVNVESLKSNIAKLVKMDGYWGTFIEGFEKIDGSIHVVIGS